ncbi:MAG: phosphatase PAP2 family protein [Cyclobacteriaceae bacterium]|nr:phosphatase PAP2 family protein [Cyclobacteriaceae bacterium]
MAVAWQLPQLDFIVTLQQSGNETQVKFLQLVSDSITIISLGIPFLIALRGEFKTEKVKTRLSFLYVGLTAGLAGIFSYVIKKLVSEPRPYEVDERIAQWSVGGGFSFPSGHTTEAFATATAMVLLYRSWKVALPAYSWALLIGYSRMHLGVHYPFDVLAGMIIGISCAYFLSQVFIRKTSLGQLS